MSAIKPVELKQFVENNPKLVTRRESKRYPGLFTLKYTRAVFYDALWDANPLLLECRGLVVDSDYNVVVKPFTKVFNYQENGTTIDPEDVCCYVRKVNGFMACVTRNSKYSDNLIISTTGSLDSEHVDLAKKHIPSSYWWHAIAEGETLIFEICDPSDPHIVHEDSGAWLIGGYVSIENKFLRHSEDNLDYIADEIGMKRFKSKFLTFGEILDLSKIVTHEGFMVKSFKTGQELKIKSPHYLITKFLARMKETRLRNIIEKGNIREAMRNFDEEYYPLITYLGENLDQFSSAEEQDRIKMIRDFLSRKE